MFTRMGWYRWTDNPRIKIVTTTVACSEAQTKRSKTSTFKALRHGKLSFQAAFAKNLQETFSAAAMLFEVC